MEVAAAHATSENTDISTEIVVYNFFRKVG